MRKRPPPKPETIAKMRATLTGKPKTLEHRAKIAATSKKHRHSAETRAKLSLLAKAREQAKREAREDG